MPDLETLKELFIKPTPQTFLGKLNHKNSGWALLGIAGLLGIGIFLLSRNTAAPQYIVYKAPPQNSTEEEEKEKTG